MKQLARMLVLVFGGFAVSAQAGGSIEVRDVWARATPPVAANGAVYLTLENRGDVPDRLTGASSPAAAQVELHTHVHHGMAMRMEAMSDLPIAPGQSVRFMPGGHHIMLLGLKRPLNPGARFPLTLSFERAGKITTQVEVRGLDATP